MMDEPKDTATEGRQSACRALVPVAPIATVSSGTERPLAGFLAQLIANDRRVPAYRRARLAEPAEATGRYSAPRPATANLLDCVV